MIGFNWVCEIKLCCCYDFVEEIYCLFWWICIKDENKFCNELFVMFNLVILCLFLIRILESCLFSFVVFVVVMISLFFVLLICIEEIFVNWYNLGVSCLGFLILILILLGRLINSLWIFFGELDVSKCFFEIKRNFGLIVLILCKRWFVNKKFLLEVIYFLSILVILCWLIGLRLLNGLFRIRNFGLCVSVCVSFVCCCIFSE